MNSSDLCDCKAAQVSTLLLIFVVIFESILWRYCMKAFCNYSFWTFDFSYYLLFLVSGFTYSFIVISILLLFVVFVNICCFLYFPFFSRLLWTFFHWVNVTIYYFSFLDFRILLVLFPFLDSVTSFSRLLWTVFHWVKSLYETTTLLLR